MNHDNLNEKYTINLDKVYTLIDEYRKENDV